MQTRLNTRLLRLIYLMLLSTPALAKDGTHSVTDINNVVGTFAAGASADGQCHDTILGTPSASQDSLIAPEAVKYVDQNFTNISVLTKDQRQSLYYLFSRFYKCIDPTLADQQEAAQRQFQADRKMPIFNNSGFAFVILKPGEAITDLPQYAALKGKKVRDVYPDMNDDDAGNRLEESISAEGSHRMMVLSAADCKSSIHDEYHVPYHEFTHFLHLTVLNQADVAKVHNLYLDAKKNNKFLDDYAATNEFEYFAQGVEAYLSITKTDKSYVYYKSDRNDLLKTDPALYQYVASLVNRCSL